MLFTSYHLFVKWKRVFKEQNFVVSNAPLVLVKRTGMLQKSSSPRYPQNGCEFALVSRQRRNHPQGFQPRFSEQYRLIKCSHSRRFSIIDSIPPVKRKLKYPGTNRPVRIEEKSTLMLAEIMATFCPEGGTVLDAYGGTLTTALACITTGRKCIVAEKMADCFEIAETRLQHVAAEKIRRIHTTSSQTITGQTDAAEIIQAIYMHESESNTDNEDNDEVDEDDQSRQSSEEQNTKSFDGEASTQD